MPAPGSAHRSLSCTNLSFAYGPTTVLAEVSLAVRSGDRIGIVGANGSGKSTLLRLLAGELPAASGRVDRTPADISVGLLAQALVDDSTTAIGWLRRRTGIEAVVTEFDAAVGKLATGGDEASDRYDRALHAWLAAEAATFDERAMATLDRVGLGESLYDADTRTLSGGQRARLGLAAIMLSAYDIVLLDEPTNDLDLNGLSMLEDFVRTALQPMVIVSHDRAFLAAVTTSIVELDHAGRATRFNGGYDAWLVERQRAKDLHQRAYDDYQAKRSTLADRARREKQWSAQGVNRVRRSAENDKFIRAGKIASSEKRAGKAAQTERALERLDREQSVDAPWKPWELQLRFGEAGRSGDEVVVLQSAVFERGDSFRLGPLDLVIEAGDRLLITGDNGAGKTTLIDGMLGRLAATSGRVHLGRSVVPGLLAQRRELFAAEDGLTDAFAVAAGCTRAEARSQLAKLDLAPQHLDRPVASLSLGERTRAALGLFAAVGTNLLLVDEPTNHLDLPGIEALESALAVYPHTLVVVSHDRRLIENLEFTSELHLD